MRFGVLGPLEVRDDDAQLIGLGGPQPRAVLAALIAARGDLVAADVLIDILWGDAPPASATSTLQSYISRLRRALALSGDVRLESEQSAYRLVTPEGSVDLDEFEESVADARRFVDEGDPRRASEVMRAALALWRGPALSELADHQPSMAEAARIEELRLTVHEQCLDVDLGLGRHHDLVSELTALVAEHPVRESLHAKLAIALYRAGRQTEALRSLDETARVLRDELGLEPGPAIREVEQAILQHAEWIDHTGPVVRATPVGGVSDFVGRDAELQMILDALSEASDDARFVVIDGEPGIGKTRLAEEVRRRAAERGSTAVWGRCDERGAAPALWPWLAIIRELVRDAGANDDTVADLLSGSVPLVAGQGGSLRFETFEAIAELLDGHDGVDPLVLLLDDIQWADATSLELLQFLTTRLTRGVLVVCTTRTPTVGRHDELTDTLGAIARRHGSQRHRLSGLATEDTAKLLKATLPTPVSRKVIRAIHDRAEGNPFYTIQLAGLLGDDGHPQDDVPPTVRDAVRRRLTLLAAATTDLLTVAATIGRDFDLRLLAAADALTVDACADLLESALEERILIESDPPGTFRFSHALVREVLLDGLTSLSRARLHLSVADAMEGRGDGLDQAEVLAEHLWRAASLTGPQRAAEALERAAEVALHRVAYASAEDLLDRATRLRRSAPRSPAATAAELAIMVRFLEVTQATRYFCGADHALLERARSLASELDEVDLALELLWFQWSSLATAAEVSRGTALIDELHERCRRDERPSVRSIGEASRGVALWSVGDLEGAMTQFDLAVGLVDDVGEPVDAFEAESRLSARSFQLWVRVILGLDTPDHVYAEFDAFIDASPTSSVPAGSCFASTTAAMLQRFDHLEHFVARARAADPSAQFAFWGGQLLMYEAMLAADSGRIDEAVQRFDEGRTRYLSVGARSCLPTFEAILGEILARHGRLDPARSLVKSAWERMTSSGEEFNRPVVVLADAAVALHGGDFRAAESHIEAARRAVESQRANGFNTRIDELETQIRTRP